MNKIYQELLKNKIYKFVYDYTSAKKVFEKVEKRNKLFHPGEYGVFREKICAELIEFAIPKKFDISSGFIINSFNEVSPQTDLIIYDLNNTPSIISSSNTRFFPVESTVAIGEIKSKLSIDELCKAISKMAKIKRLKKLKSFFCVNNPKHKEFIPHRHYADTIFTFLICEKIASFKFDKIIKRISYEYKKNNIEPHFQHNVILSLHDGIIAYKNQFDDISVPLNRNIYFPSTLERSFNNSHINNGIVKNVSFLLSSLANFLMTVHVYYPEPTVY